MAIRSETNHRSGVVSVTIIAVRKRSCGKVMLYSCLSVHMGEGHWLPTILHLSHDMGLASQHASLTGGLHSEGWGAGESSAFRGGRGLHLGEGSVSRGSTAGVRGLCIWGKGVCILHQWGGDRRLVGQTYRYGQQACGTHPIGMLSCLHTSTCHDHL